MELYIFLALSANPHSAVGTPFSDQSNASFLIKVENGSRNAADGLKQLATSGVHTHTLSCMLMISELTPDSKEFRRIISRERQQQRNERRWYFTRVEVGGATDFLADQLLKTRAGENVVALLAAIASTLDVTSCTEILSSLFDVAGVSLDNTPDLAEFDKMREALLPLIRRTEFKEKVGHYHYRFHSLLDTKRSMKINPYEAMPHAKDISTIVCMLSNLTRNPDQILNYSGFTGAGWVAAYASYILGIKTCVIDSLGQTLPINSALEDAKVVIWISFLNQDAHYELSIAGKIE
ncbi:hypothetical protein MMC26_001751 [Xylographa opegraphella]|nr:hypothetical protein [Xylographa opegraphella]